MVVKQLKVQITVGYTTGSKYTNIYKHKHAEEMQVNDMVCSRHSLTLSGDICAQVKLFQTALIHIR